MVMDAKAVAALARSAQVGPAKTDPGEWARVIRGAQCTGKATFDTRFLAAKVAKRIAGRKRSQMVAYRCDKCGKWHVGAD